MKTRLLLFVCAQKGTAVGDYNVKVRRANIHSCENGFDVDGLITVEDSFIHDPIPYDPVTDPHVDGLQITPVGNTRRSAPSGRGRSAKTRPT